MANQDLSGRSAARARRNAQVQGKAALPAKSSVTYTAPAPSAKPANSGAATSGAVSANSGRDASRARRQALSQRGKTGAASNDRQRTAQTLRCAQATAPEKKDCGCGCNGRGDCGDAATTQVRASAPVASKAASASRRNEVKTVVATNAGRLNSRMRRQALSAHGKTGADAYRKGASAAQLVRQQNPEISGRDLARTVRTQRSTNGAIGATRSQPAGRRRPERPSNAVSGTKVAHSAKTTGDETGLCRTITGTEYFSSDVFTEFCQTDTPRAPRKVETTETLRGGKVTSGGKVGRSSKVTGDERGSCRTVTGSEYVGREQFDDFCATKPEPGSAKVSFSQTTRGQIVSGSKPARARQVTGNEAGTCKAVTGTPYAGVEQYSEYCEAGAAQQAAARSQRLVGGNVGREITGLQPGFAGLTGAGKGACRAISGTAYTGASQQAEVCATAPAQIGESDFPQPLGGETWGEFSIVPPSHASQQQGRASNVTGTRYEQGRISGTFAMGEGKITGTEQFRFGEGKARAAASSAPAAQESAKSSRITGEGIDTGLKITGDDWNRGDRVTGTEGTSAVRRNPTRRGPISAMPAAAPKRKEEVVRSDTKVTGSAGTTEKGAPVTVSGGARG
ncbi:MAG: CsoS2 family carboxysome shell protein [Pseudomonadota bacterium]